MSALRVWRVASFMSESFIHEWDGSAKLRVVPDQSLFNGLSKWVRFNGVDVAQDFPGFIDQQVIDVEIRKIVLAAQRFDGEKFSRKDAINGCINSKRCLSVFSLLREMWKSAATCMTA